ncbi:MAG: helix-turn-helix domain-containing protein [Candidatus Kerfeldbacteria bacterium]
MDFKKKKLDKSKTLGERLRITREELNVSVDQAAQEVQIQKKYLIALEEGNYSSLPGPVYIESFLKKYAEYLGVSSDFVLSIYNQHEKRVYKEGNKQTFSPKPKELPKEFITPLLIRRIMIGVVILLALTYVGFEVSKIFSPPKLIISSPADFLTVNDNILQVTGATDSSAILTINGKEILINEDGNFSETISLKEGINDIVISSIKEKSKATSITKHILYEISQTK